jgi:hypothetical protein
MKIKIIKSIFVLSTLVLLIIASLSISSSSFAETDCSAYNPKPGEPRICYDYAFINGCCRARHATVPLNWCEVYCE